MEQYRTVIENYMQALDQSDLPAMLALFEEDAIAHSPILGEVAASEFFPKVFDASRESNITVLDIFVSVYDRPRAVGYLHYDWTLKDGTEISFDAADVFEFSENNKISSLIIYYDTYPIRELVGDKYQ